MNKSVLFCDNSTAKSHLSPETYTDPAQRVRFPSYIMPAGNIDWADCATAISGVMGTSTLGNGPLSTGVRPGQISKPASTIALIERHNEFENLGAAGALFIISQMADSSKGYTNDLRLGFPHSNRGNSLYADGHIESHPMAKFDVKVRDKQYIWKEFFTIKR